MLCANFDAFMAVALSWMRYKMLSKSVVDYDQRWEKNGPQGLFFPALVIINNKYVANKNKLMLKYCILTKLVYIT